MPDEQEKHEQADFSDEELKLLDEARAEVVSEERSAQSGVAPERVEVPKTMPEVIQYARAHKNWVPDLLDRGVEADQVSGAMDRINAEGWFERMGSAKPAETITEDDLIYLEEEKPWERDESDTTD